MLTISCPSCGICREMPDYKVPDGPSRATCPQCTHVFRYTKPAAPAQSARGALAAPILAHPAGLTGIGGLFRESWQQFQRSFATLFRLYLLSIIAFIFPVGIAMGLATLAGMASSGFAQVITGAVGLLAGLYPGFRCFAAFLHVIVDDRLSFKGALEEGGITIVPLLWIGFLTSFIIGGGLLLFIIPGVIFLVWFFCAQFILIKEDVPGIKALLQSRDYVRGEWFNVALRLLLIWTSSVLVGAIPVAGPVLFILFLPFVIIFHYLIYRDLYLMSQGERLYDSALRP